MIAAAAAHADPVLKVSARTRIDANGRSLDVDAGTRTNRLDQHYLDHSPRDGAPVLRAYRIRDGAIAEIPSAIDG